MSYTPADYPPQNAETTAFISSDPIIMSRRGSIAGLQRTPVPPSETLLPATEQN